MKLLISWQLSCGFTATFRAYAKEERPSISRAFTKKAAASSTIYKQVPKEDKSRILPKYTPGIGDTCIHGGDEQHGF